MAEKKPTPRAKRPNRAGDTGAAPKPVPPVKPTTAARPSPTALRAAADAAAVQAKETARKTAKKAGEVATHARETAIRTAKKAGEVATHAKETGIRTARKAGDAAAQAREIASETARKTAKKAGAAATHAKETAIRTARKAGDAAAGKGKVIAATAGVVAATAAGVAAVKAFRGRKGSSKGRVYHVVPHGEDWQVMLEGNERPSGTYGTKKQAISAGRSLAQKHEPSRLIIHGGDGTIQRTHTYGEA